MITRFDQSENKTMAIFNGSMRGDRDTGRVAAAPPPGKRGAFSIIGPDVVITGNIATTADLHIDGRVDGDVACGNLIQGGESHIVGAIRADTARLAGTTEGSVSVRQLTVERAARIIGDLEYEAIAIETGASIDGRLKHVTAEPETGVFEPAEQAVVHFTTGQAA